MKGFFSLVMAMGMLMNLSVPFVLAQAPEAELYDASLDLEVGEGIKLEPIQISPAVIDVSDYMEVSRGAIFDASLSILPEEVGKVVYSWDFGDGNKDQGVEAVHSYADPGTYMVSLDIDIDGQYYARSEKEIFVYRQLYLLITDQTAEQDKVSSMIAFARDRGVFVEVVSNYEASSEFIVEEDLLKKLNEALPSVRIADAIIIWTGGSSGLAVLSRFNQSLTESSIFQNKEFVVITNQSFRTMGNIAQGTFRTIRPARMVLSRPEALWMLFEQDTIDAFVSDLEAREIQYDVISELGSITPFNFMSYFVNYMVEKGVPTNSLLLILMLPVIVTIVAFLKQVVGLTTMGVYTPSIIALSFVALGIQFGLLIFVMILAFGTLTRVFLRRYRLLYIPRMAIVLSIVSLTILFVMLMGAYFNISELVSISVFPMLIMSTMVEKFVSIQGERGFRQAVAMIAATIFVSVVCYYVVEWAFFKTLIFGHPELIFGFILMDIFLGRWTGLRLLEYVRFREIFRYTEEE